MFIITSNQENANQNNPKSKPTQNSKDQWSNHQEMLEGIQREGNLYSLLVGLKTGSAFMEISVKNSQEAKINVPYDPAI